MICGGRIKWCLLWDNVLLFNVKVCEMFCPWPVFEPELPDYKTGN